MDSFYFSYLFIFYLSNTFHAGRTAAVSRYPPAVLSFCTMPPVFELLICFVGRCLWSWVVSSADQCVHRDLANTNSSSQSKTSESYLIFTSAGTDMLREILGPPHAIEPVHTWPSHFHNVRLHRWFLNIYWSSKRIFNGTGIVKWDPLQFSFLFIINFLKLYLLTLTTNDSLASPFHVIKYYWLKLSSTHDFQLNIQFHAETCHIM